MAQKRGKPGAKRGQPKPLKREVDPAFPARLASAIGNKSVPALATKLGCSKAVLGKYLNGKHKSPEALLLYALAEELKVSLAWLLTGRGGKTVTHDRLKEIQRWLDNAEDDEKQLFFKFTEKFTGGAQKGGESH